MTLADSGPAVVLASEDSPIGPRLSTQDACGASSAVAYRIEGQRVAPPKPLAVHTAVETLALQRERLDAPARTPREATALSRWCLGHSTSTSLG